MRIGWSKRLAEVRRQLKCRLYADLSDLVEGEIDEDTTAKVVELFNRLADLEMEDGPGDLARLLAGLPPAFVNELRQKVQRLTDPQSPDARSET
jgi:hypothetical protein